MLINHFGTCNRNENYNDGNNKNHRKKTGNTKAIITKIVTLKLSSIIEAL